MFKKFIYRFLIAYIFLFTTLIINKKDNKNILSYDNIKDMSMKHTNFLKIANIYTIIFNKETIKKVDYELIDYEEIEKYNNGVLITLKQEAVTSISNGVVVKIGKDKNYNKYLIIKDNEGIEYKYSNLIDINCKLYDYINLGEIIGISSNNNLYLTIKENNEYINIINYLNLNEN